MARNNVLVPESKQAMDAFKMEVANSLNVNLKQGYNGDLTSREAGSVGGEMVKRMIAYAENNLQKYNVGYSHSKKSEVTENDEQQHEPQPERQQLQRQQQLQQQ